MKKKFENEQEVIELIDQYHKQMDGILAHIEQVVILADGLRNTMEAFRIEGLRAKVESMHHQIEWRSGRLDTLKEVLSEIRTQMLPFGSLNNLDGTMDATVTLELEESL